MVEERNKNRCLDGIFNEEGNKSHENDVTPTIVINIIVFGNNGSNY
jgi:hypothetical protein